MSVRRLSEAVVALEGVCSVEDAETLLSELLASPGASVDWSACEAAHTAVVQVLLASNAFILGPPRSEFLSEFVEPALAAG